MPTEFFNIIHSLPSGVAVSILLIFTVTFIVQINNIVVTLSAERKLRKAILERHLVAHGLTIKTSETTPEYLDYVEEHTSYHHGKVGNIGSIEVGPAKNPTTNEQSTERDSFEYKRKALDSLAAEVLSPSEYKKVSAGLNQRSPEGRKFYVQKFLPQ